MVNRDACHKDIESMVTIIPRAYALPPRIIPDMPAVQE